MSAFLTIFLAVIMAVSPMGGKTVNLTEPVSFDAGVKLDAESVLAIFSGTELEVPEETQQGIKAVADILGVLTFEGTVAGDTVEVDLQAGESSLATFGMKFGEEGAVIASSLLGTQVLSATEETLQEMQEGQTTFSVGQGLSFADYRSLMDTIGQLDGEQIRQDCIEAGDALAKAIGDKLGETETGAFTVDGMAFTGKTPVNMTYPEFMELLMNAFKELVGKDSLKPIVQKAGAEIEKDIDSAIENLRNQPEDQQPQFVLTVYTAEDQSVYYACDLSDREDSTVSEKTAMHFGFGDAQGKKQIHASMTQGSQKMDLNASGTEAGNGTLMATISAQGTNAVIVAMADGNGNMNLVCNIKGQDVDAIIKANTEAKEDGRIGFEMKLTIGNSEKPLLTVAGSYGKGGEPVSVFEGEGITVTPLEDLINDKTGEASTPILMTAAANAMTAVVALTKVLPADTSAWLMKQITQMMMPTKTTPTSEPVVDGE